MELVADFKVCEEGKPLSPKAAHILVIRFISVLQTPFHYNLFAYTCFYLFWQRLLGKKMATFKLTLLCRWSPIDFELYKEGLDLSDVETS